jgi:acyl-CoA thioesterase FadM
MQKKALLAMVEHAKFRTLVRPGDQLQITVTALAGDSDLVRTDAVIEAGGRLVADARLVFSLEDAEEFYPARLRYLIDILYHNWLRDAVVVSNADTSEESC